MTRVLVAGVGNIFCGDDAYGVEVTNRLLRKSFPSEVDVKDFGIRGLDLAYALTDGYEFVIVIDAAARGQEPGSISIVEPERAIGAASGPQPLLGSAHGLDPEKVLRFATTLGATCKRIFFVVCEPFTLGDEDGQMGLSDVVAASVEPSVHLVESLVTSLLREGEIALGAC
ncbi:hydrogenase maturation protease [Methylocystis parvus]|uniref:Hydrogenase maturation protease n=1 Tax=Methylocystis parvus TaxID=134 RepID=A0A6B8MHQ8_9HYPH|nr:hydrogenase maturation protease [Methylocystis parvus]QGN00171.1 hydrogenase maturation protease [Methylocystis parvus]